MGSKFKDTIVQAVFALSALLRMTLRIAIGIILSIMANTIIITSKTKLLMLRNETANTTNSILTI